MKPDELKEITIEQAIESIIDEKAELKTKISLLEAKLEKLEAGIKGLYKAEVYKDELDKLYNMITDGQMLSASPKSIREGE